MSRVNRMTLLLIFRSKCLQNTLTILLLFFFFDSRLFFSAQNSNSNRKQSLDFCCHWNSTVSFKYCLKIFQKFTSHWVWHTLLLLLLCSSTISEHRTKAMIFTLALPICHFQYLILIEKCDKSIKKHKFQYWTMKWPNDMIPKKGYSFNVYFVYAKIKCVHLLCAWGQTTAAEFQQWNLHTITKSLSNAISIVSVFMLLRD